MTERRLAVCRAGVRGFSSPQHCYAQSDSWRLPLRQRATIGPAVVLRDAIAALRFRLPHRLGVYNAVQKTLYLGVLAAGVIMVLSGLAIWKPGQFQELTWLFGGFDVARVIHFLGMAAIVAFLVVHIALVIIVPKTLPAMITGRASAHAAHSED